MASYWLSEEFCREHGMKGPSRLAREFTDTGVSGWGNRRQDMRAAHPEMVPLLNRQGYPLDGTTIAPEQQDADPTRDEVEAERSEESVEILDDGNYRSTKLLRMDAEQCKSRAFLLAAHGFDPSEWEIVSARNNIWNVFSKNPDKGNVVQPHIVSTLYSSRITVRPLATGFRIAEVAAALCSVEPVEVAQPAEGERMLEVNASDMHLGNSTFEWYRANLERIVALVTSRVWAEVLLPIGSDLFHCDNFKNTTSNGTAQSSVAWPEAYADALRFWSAVIEAALAHSPRVSSVYVVGNHDESMAWMFCQVLAAKYPQVAFDLEIAERKVHTFGDVAIGMTHGDNKTRKDLDRIFMAEFPGFARALIREVHAGHYHHEVSVDEYGVVVRSLSTAARTDKWHREEGYVGACKRFHVFEYAADALTSIHYV